MPELLDDSCSVLLSTIDVRSLFATPRIFILRISLLNYVVQVVGFHAPDSDRGGISVTQWWDDEFSGAISKYIDFAHPVIFIGDGNGTVGSISSSSVGPQRPALEDKGGACIHKFCLKFDLWIPNTFEQCAGNVDVYTYNGRNHIKRIGYIFLCKNIPIEDVSLCADGVVDLTFSLGDHIPSGYILRLPVVHQERKCCHKFSLPYNRAAVGMPVYDFQFFSKIQRIDDHPPFLDAASMEHYYQTSLLHSATPKPQNP